MSYKLLYRQEEPRQYLRQPDREFRRLGQIAGAAAFLDKKDLDAATMQQMIDDIDCLQP